MRIYGYFDERYDPPAPFIRTTLTSRTLKLEHAIELHIDTGAAASILLDKDVKRLKIDVSKLRTAERDLIGIGGLLKTQIIEDAILIFRSADGSPTIEKLRLLVGTHDSSKLSLKEREAILKLPSLLGRDVIYRFKLMTDKLRNQIYLER